MLELLKIYSVDLLNYYILIFQILLFTQMWDYGENREKLNSLCIIYYFL